MPDPVSDTATVNMSSAAVTWTLTSPTSVNLMALPTRLSSTCASRRSSPLPGGRSEPAHLEANPFSVARDSTDVKTVYTTSSME